MKFRSKKDLYKYFTEMRKKISFLKLICDFLVHLYLPPIDCVNKDFLKQILVNEKMLLQLDEVRFIRVPKYEELTVKTLYPQALEDERLKKFLPDDTSKTKPMDRQFFFNVLNSVYPEYVASVIKDTSKLRREPG